MLLQMFETLCFLAALLTMLVLPETSESRLKKDSKTAQIILI